MFKFTVLYRQVDEPQKIDEFFSSVHLQLAEQLPGLVKSEVSRVMGKPGGDSRYYMMYELYFESYDSFQEGLITEPGLQLMHSLKAWDEANLLTWFYTDSFEEFIADRE